MVKLSELRKKFIRKAMKKGAVGLKLTNFGKKFKVRKHK